MERLNQINKELKVYINESSFISQKCRNKLLKMFADEFGIQLDISNYKNVDLKIEEDFRILYREDYYIPEPSISSMKELEEKYHSFQEKANELIRHKNVDFQGRRNFNNFTNLLLIICLSLLMIGIFLLALFAFFNGNYFDCLWIVVFVIPFIFPKIKSNLHDRMDQAKRYVKSLLKKVK